jgi:hypothetical protein
LEPIGTYTTLYYAFILNLLVGFCLNTLKVRIIYIVGFLTLHVNILLSISYLLNLS